MASTAWTNQTLTPTTWDNNALVRLNDAYVTLGDITVNLLGQRLRLSAPPVTAWTNQ